MTAVPGAYLRCLRPLYGHYDVQPVDPLDRWEHDPFDSSLRTQADGTREIRTRGASDDKGQVMTFIEASRAWKVVTGMLPIPMSLLIKGEEESGGASLPPFLRAYADELRADIGLICNTNMRDLAVRINADTRLRALKSDLLIMAGLSLLAIVPAGWLPDYKPGEIPANPPPEPTIAEALTLRLAS